MKKHLFVAFLLFAFFANSQTPCENNLAGEYPCNDYDLMSLLPVSTLANNLGNPEGSDVWGWTDPATQKEYVIAAMTNSTAFVDITDPINPVFLGRLDTENGNTSFWRDVKVYNNHAFIVADNVGNHGMQVFDLTKLRGVTTPQNFTSDAVFNGVGSCHNIVINENSATAYLVGCNTFSGGIHFVNISDPKNPVSAGGYSADGYTHDAQVVTYNGPDTDYTGKEIFIGSNGVGGSGDKVVILDVTNKANVVKISETTYPQMGYTHQGWFTDDQKYFLLGDEGDEQSFGVNSRTIIMDFTDLDNPKVHAEFEGTTAAIDHNGYIANGWFYLANYTAGLRVFDISNINNVANPMIEIGSFDTYPSNNGTSFNGAWSVYPFFDSNNIAINDINRGLFIVKKSDRTASTVSLEKANFSIFPNPTRGGEFLTIKSQNEFQKISIYNTLGVEVASYNQIENKEYQVPIINLAKGIYFVQIDHTSSIKFIVE